MNKQQLRQIKYTLMTKLYYSLRRIFHALFPLSVRWHFAGIATRVRNVCFPESESALHSLQWSELPFLSKSNGQDYFVFAIIDWYFRIQRPQHLSRGFSEAGHRVFYFSNHFENREEAGFHAEPLDASGRLFLIKLFVKNAPPIYFKAPSTAVLHQLKQGIAQFLLWTESSHNICLVQHPFWLPLTNCIPNHTLVYDCMDHHDGFGNQASEINRLEQKLMKQADLITITSSWLQNQTTTYNRQNKIVRNATEYKYFSTEPTTIFQDSVHRKIIGYYGAIAEWFDIDLVANIAQSFPECLVLLIGADTVQAQSHLRKYSNVHFTGEVPYEQLTYYLYAFNVCILPFKICPLTLATNPVKIYEYLSAGKPIVSIDLPEISQFKDHIYATSEKDIFLQLIQKALLENPDNNILSARRDFAAQQTWLHRVKEFDSALKTMHYPLISVVIVTFNNLKLTKACLQSLLEHSLYSNYELIIVDNASSDGSKENLLEFAHNHPNHKVIFNQENRGFSAANNQGLAVAKGDYLIMLNNDTYVTPGWMGTLIRHLHLDPTIGLIGPTTNNIGNEARINIRYRAMPQMIKQAFYYTSQHIGEVIDMKTLAFFCVAMSRDTYKKIGPLDESYGLGFFEDDDYCRRIENSGLRTVCARDVFVHHHLSASFNKMNTQKRQALFEHNKKLYEAKWGTWKPHTYKPK